MGLKDAQGLRRLVEGPLSREREPHEDHPTGLAPAPEPPPRPSCTALIWTGDSMGTQLPGAPRAPGMVCMVSPVAAWERAYQHSGL